MIIECCSQEKTFVRYYALLGARFCMLRREFQVGMGATFVLSSCIVLYACMHVSVRKLKFVYCNWWNCLAYLYT
jgi:hypothetical protein